MQNRQAHRPRAPTHHRLPPRPRHPRLLPLLAPLHLLSSPLAPPLGVYQWIVEWWVVGSHQRQLQQHLTLMWILWYIRSWRRRARRWLQRCRPWRIRYYDMRSKAHTQSRILTHGSTHHSYSHTHTVTRTQKLPVSQQ